VGLEGEGENQQSRIMNKMTEMGLEKTAAREGREGGLWEARKVVLKDSEAGEGVG